MGQELIGLIEGGVCSAEVLEKTLGSGNLRKD